MKRKKDFPKSEVYLLKALADLTRLKILRFLQTGERCQCELIPELWYTSSNGKCWKCKRGGEGLYIWSIGGSHRGLSPFQTSRLVKRQALAE